MTEAKGSVSVKIMGAEYRLKKTEDEDYLKKIAGMAQERMKENSAKYPLISTDRVAVLSVMQTLDELLKNRESSERAESEMRSRLEELAGLIRSTLAGK